MMLRIIKRSCLFSLVTAILVPELAVAGHQAILAGRNANLPEIGPGTYLIRSIATGQFLQLSGALHRNEKYRDNQPVSLTSDTATSVARWKKWHLVHHSGIGNSSLYYLRNLHSGKVVGASSSPGDPVPVTQSSATGGERQLWRLLPAAPGSYYLINQGTGKLLSLHNADTVLRLQAFSGSPGQQWHFEKIANDSYRDDAVVNFFNRDQRSQGSVAFDQGNSIPLSYSSNRGKVLWITQDAWDGISLQSNHRFNCNAFHSYSNSVLLQPSADDWDPDHTPNITIPDSRSNKPRQVFDIQPGTQWTWAGPGVEIDDRVYVYGGEGSGLNNTDQALYVLVQNPGETEWKCTRTTPKGMSGQVDIIYSTGMVKAGDGYVYVFGARGTNFGYSSDIFVARFSQHNPQQWTFWDGGTWGGRPVPAETARVSTGRGSSSIAYLNGKYILMTMDQGFNCDTARNIYLSTADHPTGPFTQPKLVYTITEYLNDTYARYYTPVIHPEFDNGRNELLVTYCLNFSGCGEESCQDGYLDPYYYRVKGVRIPFELFGLANFSN